MTIHEIDVTERVCEILQEHLGPSITFSPESDLLNDLGMDSLELVELGLRLEKAFSRKIPTADLRGCASVEEVLQLVQRIVAQEEARNV